MSAGGVNLKQTNYNWRWPSGEVRGHVPPENYDRFVF